MPQTHSLSSLKFVNNLDGLIECLELGLVLDELLLVFLLDGGWDAFGVLGVGAFGADAFLEVEEFRLFLIDAGELR